MKRGRGQDDSENWIGVSDLMAGIAIIFIAFTTNAIVKQDPNGELMQMVKGQARQIAGLTRHLVGAIVITTGPPTKEFCEIMQKAEGALEANGIQVGSCTGGRVNLVFDDQETQFKPASSEVPERLKTALNIVIPEALGSIREEELKPYVESFVVEGHTSDEWIDVSTAEAYWLNMELSQNRAREVLKHIREKIIKPELEQYCWIRKIGSASGLSSRDLIIQENGIANRRKSRRIEIVILTQAEPQRENLPPAEHELCKKEFTGT